MAWKNLDYIRNLSLNTEYLDPVAKMILMTQDTGHLN